ncbi:hypothetical protein BZG36_04725 [Bifiguratus adelaidae]|uniref:Xylanolytic transcriptional activator regulatory domain-containing protein n=1 Tax=Bifiguratus adelaidae TaxID=1938954 RepID=A0A261XUE8_9FUNG|nr:hypothetical protein BZG36_04725 [Bifiguratus adelaidae]
MDPHWTDQPSLIPLSVSPNLQTTPTQESPIIKVQASAAIAVPVDYLSLAPGPTVPLDRTPSPLLADTIPSPFLSPEFCDHTPPPLQHRQPEFSRCPECILIANSKKKSKSTDTIDEDFTKLHMLHDSKERAHHEENDYWQRPTTVHPIAHHLENQQTTQDYLTPELGISTMAASYGYHNMSPDEPVGLLSSHFSNIHFSSAGSSPNISPPSVEGSDYFSLPSPYASPDHVDTLSPSNVPVLDQLSGQSSSHRAISPGDIWENAGTNLVLTPLSNDPGAIYIGTQEPSTLSNMNTAQQEGVQSSQLAEMLTNYLLRVHPRIPILNTRRIIQISKNLQRSMAEQFRLDSVLAVGARCANFKSEIDEHEKHGLAEFFANKAVNMVEHLGQELGWEACQGLILLFLYVGQMSDDFGQNEYVRKAAENDGDWQEMDDEERSHCVTWWICYTLEQWACAANGTRPLMSIQEADIPSAELFDAQAPSSEVFQMPFAKETGPCITFKADAIVQIIRLTKILNTIMSLSYSSDTQQYARETIDNVEARLSAWMAAIKPKYALRSVAPDLEIMADAKYRFGSQALTLTLSISGPSSQQGGNVNQFVNSSESNASQSMWNNNNVTSGDAINSFNAIVTDYSIGPNFDLMSPTTSNRRNLQSMPSSLN